MQPYHARNPTNTPIWYLHTLDITDKHRVIPTVLGSNLSTLVFGPAHLLELEDGVRVSGGAFNNGDELLRIRADLARDLSEQDEPRFTFDVTLDIEGPLRGVDAFTTLNGIHRAIRDDLIPQFQPFFPSTK